MSTSAPSPRPRATPGSRCSATPRRGNSSSIAASRKCSAKPISRTPCITRILPPTFEERQLPQPRSRGARATVRYCVQCHNLPNPAMHHAQKWPGIVERMVLRMQGRGNLGTLMSEMMAGVQAPSQEETAVLIAYLKRHAQKPLDPQRYPEVNRA